MTGEGAPYVASKFAVVGLTEALALYARPFGIGVSLLCPGRGAHEPGRDRWSIGMTPERAASETLMAQAVQGAKTGRGPEEIGEMVVRAVAADQFLILTDQVHSNLIRRRADDMNAYIEGRFSALS